MIKIDETGHPDWIAVVENRIIEARHSFTPNAQKLLLLAISRIQEPGTATELPDITITVKEFQRCADITSNNTYQQLDRACDELMHNPLEIRVRAGDRARKTYSWFDTATYDGQGQITLRFTKSIGEFLIGLKSRFTQLRIERFFKLRSGYSMRFLEMITQMDGNRRPAWTMSIDELRDWLATPKTSYPSFGMLRVRVLETAQKELDAKSDRSFDFTPLKNGREFRGIEFRIRPSRQKSPQAAAKILANEPDEISREALRKALDYARSRQRWSEGWPGVGSGDGPATDEQIQADPIFADILKRYVEEAKGQRNLDLPIVA
jgi:plasmid replication initiation protein